VSGLCGYGLGAYGCYYKINNRTATLGLKLHEGSINMHLKELIIQELDQSSEWLLAEVLDFLKFLKAKSRQETLEVSLLSESSLQKDWLRPEEDEAWQDL
jgi:hypothetical protein